MFLFFAERSGNLRRGKVSETMEYKWCSTPYRREVLWNRCQHSHRARAILYREVQGRDLSVTNMISMSLKAAI